MANRLFSCEQQEELLKNINVLSITDKTVSYCPEFKVEAVLRNMRGTPPSAIFIDAGIDLDIIGRKTPKETLKRWRRLYKQHGESGLLNESFFGHMKDELELGSCKSLGCKKCSR
jgi:hypothetical protein